MTSDVRPLALPSRDLLTRWLDGLVDDRPMTARLAAGQVSFKDAGMDLLDLAELAGQLTDALAVPTFPAGLHLDMTVPQVLGELIRVELSTIHL